MDLKNINLVLANLERIRNPYNERDTTLKQITKVETRITHAITDSDGSQGDEGIFFEVYKLPFDELCLQMEIRTDSYGDNERIYAVQFGKLKERTVMTFQNL